MIDAGRYIAKVGHLWRDLARRRLVERDLDDEVDAIVDLLAAEKMRAGLDPDAARHAAASELGGIARLKALMRAEWSTTGNMAAVVVREIQVGTALVVRTPLVSATAGLALAIGIAANFAVFNAVRPTIDRLELARHAGDGNPATILRSLATTAQAPGDWLFVSAREPGPSPFVEIAAWPASAQHALSSRVTPATTSVLASARSSRPRRNPAARAPVIAATDDTALRLQARVTSPP